MVLYRSDLHKTYRKQTEKGQWKNLGAFGTNALVIQRSSDLLSQAQIIITDSKTAITGRSPRVSGCIMNLRAKRADTDPMSIIWSVKNVQHYGHIKTYCTRFKSLLDSELFLRTFNGCAVEVEDRVVFLAEAEAATTTPATREVPAAINASGLLGRCHECNNKGPIGDVCHNCGTAFLVDEGSTTTDGSSSDEDDRSVDLLTRSVDLLMSLPVHHTHRNNVDFDSDIVNDRQLGDDPPTQEQNTQQWPPAHDIKDLGLQFMKNL